MLEVPAQFASWAFHFYDFGIDLDFHPIRDVHGLRQQNCLHGFLAQSVAAHSLVCSLCFRVAMKP